MKSKPVLLLLATALAVVGALGHISAAPTPLAGITSISAGEGGFALALRHDGAVLGWGGNSAGTLGNGTTDPNLLPSAVFGLGVGSGVVAVAPSTGVCPGAHGRRHGGWLGRERARSTRRRYRSLIGPLP